jgi:hypothetical protein
MPHLTLEALARLVDEAPTGDESRHLAECDRCREELDALREQTESLSQLPKMAPPPDLWPELRTRLRREGLVNRAPRVSPALTRIAAALALFIAGGATGFLARGSAPQPAPVASAQDTEATPAANPTTPTTDPATADPAGTQLASGDVAEVERAQEMFAAALDRYMRANSTPAPDPAARLAALDNIVLTTAEALNQSPADPVINSFHLTAVAERNQLLRQVAASGEPVF